MKTKNFYANLNSLFFKSCKSCKFAYDPYHLMMAVGSNKWKPPLSTAVRAVSFCGDSWFCLTPLNFLNANGLEKNEKVHIKFSFYFCENYFQSRAIFSSKLNFSYSIQQWIWSTKITLSKIKFHYIIPKLCGNFFVNGL